MARKIKSHSTSPNKALVIILVVFVLGTLGFGIWGYTLSKERDKWDSAAKNKDLELKSTRQESEWTKYQRDELLAAIGEPEFQKKAEALKNWRDNREFFLKQQKFKDEEGSEEFRKFIKTFLEPKLGVSADGYKDKFAELPDPLRAQLAKAQQDYAAEGQKNNAKQKEFLALQKKHNADRDSLLKEIRDGTEKAVEARMKASEALTVAIKQFDDRGKSVEEKDLAYSKELAKRDAELVKLRDKVRTQEALAKSPNRSLGEPHALVLDISKGKPLWDVPRGKVIGVAEAGKKIVIDKGSKDGVKPGLTFAVFAAGKNGRGEGEMKATIEVVRVESPGSSLCKVNTYYEADGHEIAVTDATPAKVLRDGGSVVQEGDLLFNLFWGTHVAIVGIVEIPGLASKSAAGQMADLSDFMHQLERAGITVDAYTDPRDGKLVGELTVQTNFLIKGDPATKLPDSDDNRNKAIKDAIAAMREQAVERGMFIISPANFAVVTGLRRASSDGVEMEPLAFVPGRPAGNPVGQGQANPATQKKDQ